MRTKIISAFPGVEKTHFFKENQSICLDSDSSEFSWTIDVAEKKKVRNPDFPENYIKHIKENIGKYEYIFVSSHKEVREALKDNCLFFYLIFPSIYLKEEYLERYKLKESPKQFIDFIESKWIEFISELYQETEGCKAISIDNTGYHLTEILPYLEIL